MATDLVMPRLSDTMDSGTIGKWLKKEGDPVKRGEIVAEIETDKANMEFESYANGILAVIIKKEGESAGVGEPIATVAASEEEAKELQAAGPSTAAAQGETSSEGAPAPSATAQAEAQPSSPPETPPQAPEAAEGAEVAVDGRVKASPLAKRIAADNNVNLTQVTGTGPGGRITKEDVEAFIKQGGAAAPAAERPAAAAAAAPAAEAPPAPPQPAAQTGGAAALRGAEPVQMTRMQQTIARRMTESRFSAPDFVLSAEFDMTAARLLLASFKEVEGAPKVGPNDLLIKAVAAALQRHPELNAGWENNTITKYNRINIGNAVAIPGGLIVPVIKDADQKSLGTIAQESKALIGKARDGKLQPSEFEGGTFTISNLGMFGIKQFTPVINTPEACIMGVGSIVPTPVVVDGEIAVRDRMTVTLAVDHRVANGAQGAEFLRTLRSLLENPMLSLL